MGGCYYIIWNHKGIVVDPGFDFVKVFDRQSRTLEDIDAVIVTHDHPDHCEGVADILTLLHELNEKKAPLHQIRFAVSRGTYLKYASIFRKNLLKNSVTRLSPNKTYTVLPGVTVSTIKNKHREIHCKGNGIGVKFYLSNLTFNYSFGITSDTGYNPSLPVFYDGTDMLIAHIGTLEDFSSSGLMSTHLGFRGIVLLLRSMTKPPSLALVSEWGEELHKMRKTIGEHIEKHVSTTHVLPADLSFILSIPDNKIYIEQDDQFALAKNTFVSNDYGDRLRYMVK